MRYASAGAFRTALEQRLLRQSEQTAVLLIRLRNVKSIIVSPRRSPAQQTLGIAMGGSLSVGGAHREVIEKSARLGHRRIRVIRRKHDPVDANLDQQVQEGGCPVEAAEVAKILLAILKGRG